ncbi:MAG TPA: sigma-70 family RNA polymerase sigma factor [Chloroflexia bacterium]|nr:sigma-70 family RNA polymerase sigma factor [Chloroflexia bacterium]
MDENDEILVERVARGDGTAFETLFHRHYGRVYRVLYGLTADREASEDLTQEAFLELYRGAREIRAGTPPAAWLCRVALNRGYNLLRDRRRATEKLERVTRTTSEEPWADLVRVEDRARVREVLAHLHERQSKILLLRYAGYSLAEMASILSLAPGSIGTLLARAEKAFEAAYRAMHPAESEPSLEKRKP